MITYDSKVLLRYYYYYDCICRWQMNERKQICYQEIQHPNQSRTTVKRKALESTWPQIRMFEDFFFIFLSYVKGQGLDDCHMKIYSSEMLKHIGFIIRTSCQSWRGPTFMKDTVLIQIISCIEAFNRKIYFGEIRTSNENRYRRKKQQSQSSMLNGNAYHTIIYVSQFQNVFK